MNPVRRFGRFSHRGAENVPLGAEAPVEYRSNFKPAARRAPPARVPTVVELALRSGDPVVERALRFLLELVDAKDAPERVRAWLRQYPERRAAHVEIAVEVGLTRESVTRALGALGVSTRRARSSAAPADELELARGASGFDLSRLPSRTPRGRRPRS